MKKPRTPPPYLDGFDVSHIRLVEVNIPKNDLDLEVIRKWIVKADNETDTSI